MLGWRPLSLPEILNCSEPAPSDQESDDAPRLWHGDVFTKIPKGGGQLSERDQRSTCESAGSQLIGRVLLAVACRPHSDAFN
jgi:hypothetical protein